MNKEIIIYKDVELELSVEVTPDKETVWLNRNQFATLFYHDIKTYKVDYYNLDMIISVSYRVKSKRGIAFRKWATTILKEYMVQEYAVNQKRWKV